MSTIEIPVSERKRSEELSPKELFFGAINNPKSTATRPVFIGYFMAGDTLHRKRESALVDVVTEFCANPDNGCALITDSDFPEVILISRSGNRLVVSEQSEIGARSYWVCASQQEPGY